jgi:hypothetical protein
MSTLQATNLKSAASASNNIVLDASGNTTFVGTAAMASSFLRNRIINGAQSVDQRNNGASASISSGTVAYITDRNGVFNAGTNAITAQRVSGPTGFQNALQITGSASNGGVNWFQRIEANNTFDLAGVSVTFSATLSASANRNVTAEVSTPNSFENFLSQTTGPNTTWAVTTTPTRFSFTFTMPANAVNGVEMEILLGPLLAGQTVTITGVQLEVGTAATPFERRLLGQELALCQRYCYVLRGQGGFTPFGNGAYVSTTQIYAYIAFPVQMRASPSVSYSAANTFYVDNGTVSSMSTDQSGPYSIIAAPTISGTATSGSPSRLLANNNSTALITISAEL